MKLSVTGVTQTILHFLTTESIRENESNVEVDMRFNNTKNKLQIVPSNASIIYKSVRLYLFAYLENCS